MATAKPKTPKKKSLDERPVFQPCSEKQRLILLDNETDILLCGGGAGGGKSHTCLTKALKFIEDPAARVLIVRESFPQLKVPGGLIDESKGIYKHFKGLYNKQDTTWTFPNGATISFKPLPDNVLEWQGSQLTHILIDEGAEFREEDVLFLVSRLRSAHYKGHMSVIITCNPSRTSFLFDWVKFSLDENGVPVEGTEHKRRWMVSLMGKVFWADDPETLWKEHGEPNGYCRESDNIADVNFLVQSFRFIPLTVYDNPILLKNNPGYLRNLLRQGRVNQLRYLFGSWTAQAEGEGRFRREWITEVYEAPGSVTGRCRSWDLAASVPSEVNRNPDWTAGVRLSRAKDGYYYVEHVHRFQKLADGVIREIVKTSHEDLVDDFNARCTIPKDPGAGGKTANSFQLSKLAEAGIAASSVQVSGHIGKLARFLPFCAMAEARMVRMVKGDWNEAWLTELEHFTGERGQPDDQVDATADAFNTLRKQVVLPTIHVPAMTQQNPIPRL